MYLAMISVSLKARALGPSSKKKTRAHLSVTLNHINNKGLKYLETSDNPTSQIDHGLQSRKNTEPCEGYCSLLVMDREDTE